MELKLSYNPSNQYWLVKNSAGETLFASALRSAADDFIFWYDIERSAGYQQWLAEQDELFAI